MASTIVRVNSTDPEPQLIADAAARIARGELVAFPTETVYGLGADALNPDAVAGIYRAKGRPAWNPLISHVATIDAARALTRQWPQSAQRLADAFWPGPLTLVLPRHDRVPDISTAGRDAIAIRIPAHPVALALLRAVNGPIAAPSANRFTHVSPTTADHVVASLGDRVACVLDGGACEVGIESTVVDLTGERATILRPGMITRAQIAAVLGEAVAVTTSQRTADDTGSDRALSPGGADRHYAPNADVWLFNAGNRREIVTALAAQSDRIASPATETVRPAIVALLLTADLPLSPADHVVRMPLVAVDYARVVYRELHAADLAGATLVIIESPPETDEWQAVHDRLTRAAR